MSRPSRETRKKFEREAARRLKREEKAEHRWVRREERMKADPHSPQAPAAGGGRNPAYGASSGGR